jgi:hypothetical protein
MTTRTLDLDALDTIERNRETVESVWRGLIVLNGLSLLFFIGIGVHFWMNDPAALAKQLSGSWSEAPMIYLVVTTISLPLYALALLSVFYLNRPLLLTTTLIALATLAAALFGQAMSFQRLTRELGFRDDLLAVVHTEHIMQLFFASIFVLLTLPQLQLTIAAFRRKDLAVLKPPRRQRASLLNFLGWPPHLPAANLSRAAPFLLFLAATLIYVAGFVLGINNIGFASGQNEAIIRDARIDPAMKVQFNATGIYVVVILNILASVLFIVGAVFLSRLIESRAKARVRFSMAEALQSDGRPPVVFLRAFADDQVVLGSARSRLFTRLMELGSGKKRLDHIVLEEGFAYGPVVALGRPGDPFPPYGAARGYFEHADWQQAVARLSSDASAIVLTVDDSDGVWWEFDHVLQDERLAKTLFLIHPRFHAPAENQRLLGVMQARVPAAGAEAARALLAQCCAIARNRPVLGFHWNASGAEIVVGTGRRFEHRSYRIMARSFLRDTAPEERAAA